jgi:hypothetical protein
LTWVVDRELLFADDHIVAEGGWIPLKKPNATFPVNEQKSAIPQMFSPSGKASPTRNLRF